MASPKQQILAVVGDDAFPITKTELITRLEGSGADVDIIGVASAIADDRFVSRAELEYRLDDALGMPDADTTTDSAVVVETEWTPDA